MTNIDGCVWHLYLCSCRIRTPSAEGVLALSKKILQIFFFLSPRSYEISLGQVRCLRESEGELEWCCHTHVINFEYKFSIKWYDVMGPDEERWNKKSWLFDWLNSMKKVVSVTLPLKLIYSYGDINTLNSVLRGNLILTLRSESDFPAGKDFREQRHLLNRIVSNIEGKLSFLLIILILPKTPLAYELHLLIISRVEFAYIGKWKYKSEHFLLTTPI